MTVRRSFVSWVVLVVLSSVLQSYGGEWPNVLFIAIDDLRTDLGALDVAYAKSPELDAFARSARVFSHHYVQVPTCGASRCALLRGRYPNKPAHIGNGAIASTHDDWMAYSLPAVFRTSGYRTLALGKISHHPGGLTGKNWAEGPEELPGAWDRCWIPKGPWQHPEAIMHGYAHGVARQAGKQRWRLIRKLEIENNTPQDELFDYQTDPEETRNHARDNPAVVAELQLLLEDARGTKK